MAMEKTYEMLYYGGLIAAIILFITAVILFFTLKIHRVVGELTGRSARRGLRDMKNRTTASQDISKKERAKYYKSGVITAHEAGDTKKSEQRTTILGGRRKNKGASEDTTTILDPTLEGDTAVLSGEAPTPAYDVKPDTEALTTSFGDDESETAVLATASFEEGTIGDDTETDVLAASGDDSETDVLTHTPDDVATDVLSSAEPNLIDSEEHPVPMKDRVKMIYDVIVVHTEEQLES